jgi:hypothetical protein
MRYVVLEAFYFYKEECMSDPDNMKTVTLPNAEEIVRRLSSVDADPYTIQNFYPLIAQHANQEKNGFGLVVMIELAIHEVTKGMPAIVGKLMSRQLPRFIKALTDDQEVIADAMNMYNEAKGE